MWDFWWKFFEQKDNINVTRLRSLVERGVDVPKIIREHATQKENIWIRTRRYRF